MQTLSGAQDSNVAVLGGGIVGVCCALALQRAGRQVVLIERDGVGQGCSKGNAGHFASEQVLPLATPGLLWKIPGMLLDPLGPVSIRWSYLHRIAPWLIRFMLNTRQQPFQQGAEALSELNAHSLPAWRRLLDAIGASSQLQVEGSLLVFESDQSFSGYRQTSSLLEQYGVKLSALSGDEVRELEPRLSREIRHGVLFPETGHTTDPFQLTQTLAEAFVQHGGRIVPWEVQSLSLTADQVQLQTDQGCYSIDQLVLAAGAWSEKFVRQLTGRGIPLDTERGYHLMLPNAAEQLEIPVTSADRRFIMTPMSEGLRLAGTVEFGGLEKAPDMRRAQMLAAHARALVPEMSADIGESWMGFRPSLPDSLPVIDQIGPQQQVTLAFGHQHLGLTQAAITAELVVEQMQKQPATVDLTPFQLARF